MVSKRTMTSSNVGRFSASSSQQASIRRTSSASHSPAGIGGRSPAATEVITWGSCTPCGNKGVHLSYLFLIIITDFVLLIISCCFLFPPLRFPPALSTPQIILISSYLSTPPQLCKSSLRLLLSFIRKQIARDIGESDRDMKETRTATRVCLTSSSRLSKQRISSDPDTVQKSGVEGCASHSKDQSACNNNDPL